MVIGVRVLKSMKRRLVAAVAVKADSSDSFCKSLLRQEWQH